jgi:plasmid stability protein
MKTTVDLPSDLVRDIKLRAVNDGRNLKDTITDVLRQGLAARRPRAASRQSRVRLPLIQCRRAAVLTPDQVADVLLKQDVAWHHDPA